MTDVKQNQCDEILFEVDSLMDSVDVARLTPGQFDEIKRLRAELAAICAAGDVDHAVRTKELILAIIKEGPPVYG